VEDRLRFFFRRWAYVEARFDVLQSNADPLEAESGLGSVYRVIDPSGEILSLCPDLTAQVAEDAATVQRSAPRPLRRSYAGRAFRRPERAGDQRREIQQAGVELIGAPGVLADAEVVTLAAEGLAWLGVRGARIHLGHVGFVRALLRSSELENTAETEICDLLARHDRRALATALEERRVDRPTADAFLELLDLTGDASILARARRLTDDRNALQALDELGAIHELLRADDLPTPVVLDLSEVRDRAYYTGIRFEGFAPAVGYPILRGGRYDDLLAKFGPAEPAVGCAFEVDRLASLLAGTFDSASTSSLLRFAPARWADAVGRARALRAAGHSVALDVGGIGDAGLASYVRGHRVSEVIDLAEADGAGGGPR
jgi:ATP phosphoribosyltransferase regulatory subunit